jgi:hypothetical protein
LTPLSEALEALMARLGLSGRASAARAVELWEEVAGPEIARKTAPSRVIDGVLYVDAESAIWASQLTLMRFELVERLNARIGGATIRDIRFRPRGVRVGRRAERGPKGGSAALRVTPGGDDEPAAERITVELGGAETSHDLRAALKKLVMTHRAIVRARQSSGWRTCPACGRTYEPRAGHCPSCAPEEPAGG